MSRNLAIQIIRGIQTNKPVLNDGEFYLAEDTQTLFLGTSFGSIRFNASSSIAFVFGGGAVSGTGVSSVSVATSFKTGNTGVIGVVLRTTTVSVSSITDGNGSVFTRRTAFNNGTSVRVELWSTAVGGLLGNSSNATVNLSAASNVVACAAQYSGVVALGNANSGSASGANPAESVNTQDPNNFGVVIYGGSGTGAFTAGALGGSLRASFNMSGSNAVGGAIEDATAFPAGSVQTSVTNSDTVWAFASLELRTV